MRSDLVPRKERKTQTVRQTLSVTTLSMCQAAPQEMTVEGFIIADMKCWFKLHEWHLDTSF